VCSVNRECTVRDHLQIIHSKSEAERILFDFKIRSTIWNDLSVTETCKRISVTKIRFTMKLQKSIPKSFCKKSVPFYKCYSFVSDPFDIRYGWICELGNIGTVCTVFKYVSLQKRKRYPKLLIKLGMDFEVGDKTENRSVSFHFWDE
jgi:hypothetical protein